MHDLERFPSTKASWIETQLRSEDGLRQVRTQLMAVYLEPLQEAARRAFGLGLAAAVDLVQGFFASRLGRPEYLLRWQDSGLRLRLWLWNGLCLYRREELRRAWHRPPADYGADPVSTEAPPPGRELDREFARSLVRTALDRAAQCCNEDGFAGHWQVFERRMLHDERLVDLARSLGTTEARVRVMLRAPQRRFERELAALLVRDGVRPEDVPRAIAELLDSVDD